jgi:hypothetical protein
VIRVLVGIDVAGTPGVDEHDIAFLHPRRRAFEASGIDQTAVRDVDPPDHARTVETFKRNLVDARPVGDEVPRRIEMGAVVHDHVHLGHVGAMLRDRGDPADAWLWK